MELQNKNEITKDMFEPAHREDKNKDVIKRPTIKYWPDVWRRLKQNKLAMVGLTIIVIFLIMSYLGTKISGYSYTDQNYDKINVHPGAEYWFGTDELGRDMFSRVWLGTRFSLIIGFLAAAMDFMIGVVYGGIAGMATRKVDSIMMRFAEVIYSIPYLLIVILLSVVLSGEGGGNSLAVLILAMSLTGWVPMAILVRGQVLQLKESEYSLAAESLGATKGWILKKHIIPNTLGPIIVNVTLTIPRAIFAEATLGYLGLGLQPPDPSLGNLSNDGLIGLAVGNAYQIIIPAIFISLIMFAFNVLGDGLRDALDPRLRK
ncbi:ABC transporter permease [Youngiibacter multivorans]|uniref:ABC-type dipeptide/oligopeptide/nickel transport system permease subunit n=1 Tax=Youngiibacter multivorans TaxID=937251 RepID=A0ABS4G5X4_9CLOT|nr:ABC transporter permease [Youngiibacter multivorans]MBP1919975.1 ABC-type dipeptide/oligopeptide/nickel transport system permease subunit [Youngiibacter multivorans]